MSSNIRGSESIRPTRSHPGRPQGNPPLDVGRGRPPRPFAEADGALRDGTTVFDDAVPGVANLDPALLSALRRAARDAARDGADIFVNSGWRSPEYQQHLLDEAVARYGSKEEAARWVATPEASAHVSGDAVDIGPANAAAWLSEHGAKYGLCPVYENEPWHFELRPWAMKRGCPPRYDDPTVDPRMQSGNYSRRSTASGRHAPDAAPVSLWHPSAPASYRKPHALASRQQPSPSRTLGQRVRLSRTAVAPSHSHVPHPTPA